MAAILAHPFRVVGNAVATVDPDSDDGLAQQVAVLLTTRKGERPIVPAFGVSDPVFSRYHIAEVNAVLAMFGIDVQITDIKTEPVSPTVMKTTVAFAERGALL